MSKKTGNPGYAPACSNKWEPGLCLLKAGGKCADCLNQAFVPVDDQIVIDHLRGRHVIGCYPLLEDETCWFLAVDFDKSSWEEDVSAFAATSRSLGVPAAIERSRSGNGAHAWFFFAAPVSANMARRMGCYLITETMTRRHELSMKSYDRLFPNQDTMPRGGFGNLIALPLQYEPRQQGNSIFVDECLEPYADQWAFLASVQRIEPGIAETIAHEATRTGQIIGVRFAEILDDRVESAPWTHSRPTLKSSPTIIGPLPSVVRGVLAQRLYIEKAGLPAPILNQLKRLAAFQNPEFYKKQRMRLSTATTARVITCAEELAQYISLPRGCANAATQLFGEHLIALSIEDERQLGSPVEMQFNGDLTDAQRDAARALLAHDTGVFVGPPGIGKTVLGTYLIAKRACSTLIVVHRKPLLEQWVAQLAMFLGIDEKQIGRIEGGQRRANGRLDVAMIQSLAHGAAHHSNRRGRQKRRLEQASREVTWIDADGRQWLRTGDLGRLDAEGFLYIVDRKKDVILSGGQNIYPADIETVMRAHPALAEVAVIGVPSARWGETPLAIVVLQAGRVLTAAELIAWTNARIGRQQRLSGIVWRDSLPRNPNGKVLKRELRCQYSSLNDNAEETT